MNINFTLSDSKTIELDLDNLQVFKNRWLELLSGYGEIEPENDLELTGAILAAETILKQLLYDLKEAEELNDKTKNQ